MVCTHVDLYIYQGEGGCRGLERGGRRFIALFILILQWWLHFSTSTPNLISCPLKLLVQVTQFKVYSMILRVAFPVLILSPPPPGGSEDPHWLGKELCPLPEKIEGKNSTLKKKRQAVYELPPLKIKEVRQKWEAGSRLLCHYLVLLLKRMDWEGQQFQERPLFSGPYTGFMIKHI